MRHVFNMLDLIKAQIQTRQPAKIIQALNVRDQIIVEIEVDQVRCDLGGNSDSRYLVLTKA